MGSEEGQGLARRVARLTTTFETASRVLSIWSLPLASQRRVSGPNPDPSPGIRRWPDAKETDAVNLAALLCARRERPRRSCTAEQRDELSALHVGPPPPESVYRTFSLPQGGRRVLWGDL
jgi:hypothetical protein